MAITADTTVHITSHNGVDSHIPYERYYTATAEAKRKAVDKKPSKNVSPNRHVGSIREREFTLDILGHGESIAVTE